MLLKAPDDKDRLIAELERLLAGAAPQQRAAVETELRLLRSGIKGERDAAYLIDFELQASKNTAVIHDLRLEVNGRVAQIDHLLLHRTLNFYVLETKHFHAGIKITDDGEFLRWSDYRKTFEGMPSPLAQNERHIAVLRDACDRIDFPTRLGVRLTPAFQSYVLVSPNVRIDRPKRFDTTRVIKADMVSKIFDETLDKAGVLDTMSNMSRLVRSETLEAIGRQLIAFHRPASIDYRARFGITEAPPVQTPLASPHAAPTSSCPAPPSPADVQKCRHCGSTTLSIQYGKFGYYFKCGGCDGNTAIKVGCGKEGHRERIRKEGWKFYRECAGCGTSAVFFVNPSA
jgi:hypothetical protein